MKLHNQLQKDDPRLLQYVLKEISTQDLQIVDQAIAQQPEIAAEIKVLTNLYAGISELQSNPKDMALSLERRKKLFADTIYKNSESASWFSKIASFGSFKYATGGLIAATFAFLVFNQSLKHEVKSSKNVTEAARVSEVQFQAPASPPAMPTANEERSRGGGEVAKRESLTEKRPMPTPAESNEMRDQKLAKKELELPQAASAEAPIVMAGSGDKAELEQALASDAVSAVADASAEKRIEGDAIARRAVEAPVVSKQQAQPAIGSNSKGLLGGSKMFSASKAAGGIKSKDSLSGFGASAVARKGAEPFAEAKSKAQENKIAIYITAHGLEKNLRDQLQEKLDRCLLQNSLNREMQMTYNSTSSFLEVRERQLNQAEKNFHSCVEKVLNGLNKSIKTIQVDIKVEPISK